MLVAKLAAASGNAPVCPIIILSATATLMCPNWVKEIGTANANIFLIELGLKNDKEVFILFIILFSSSTYENLKKLPLVFFLFYLDSYLDCKIS